MATATEPAFSPPRAVRPDRLGSWLRAIGLLCLFGALGVGGYVGWVQWGTGFLTARSQDKLRAEFDQRVAGGVSGGAAGVRVSVPGDAVAVLQIPAVDLDMVVVEGTSSEDLEKGPGHYVNTAYPWQRAGRVGIAGHRTTYLHPFWNLDKLRGGDRVRLLTEYATFEYEVTGSRVVLPSAVWVLGQTEQPTLVLTACTPRFSATHRLVVFARRVSGTASGPTVRVAQGAAATHQVGPSDHVLRTLVVSLITSFAAGAVYLVAWEARRWRRGA